MKKRPTRSVDWKKAIARLPKAARADVDQLWDTSGHLPAAQVEQLLGQLKIDLGTFMMQLLPVAQQYAVVPVSHYQVGTVAAGRLDAKTGCANLYLGANFEFRNAALSFSVHAEQAATNSAWLHGETGLHALAISAAPCGYCRQFLNELVDADQLSLLLPSDPKRPTVYSAWPLHKYLPEAFGPAALGVRGGWMDPELCTHDLVLAGNAMQDPLVATAFAAASQSYAPYLTDTEHHYCGVAVQLADGTIYPGRYAANAAYNPSLSPLESALAFMNMNHPRRTPPVVTRCALVEVPTLASQLSATQAVLASYAPTVGLEYYTAQVAPAKSRQATNAKRATRPRRT
ncbi:MAG: cytidine deaminase [Candidatus Didemnitutus sp.]|nr:cytidine deaminase [Candidatus Didemnitutus sp.]